MTQLRGLFGASADAGPMRGGGILPSYRPTYPARIARQLHDLAERRPPWPEYLRERARILEGL